MTDRLREVGRVLSWRSYDRGQPALGWTLGFLVFVPVGLIALPEPDHRSGGLLCLAIGLVDAVLFWLVVGAQADRRRLAAEMWQAGPFADALHRYQLATDSRALPDGAARLRAVRRPIAIGGRVEVAGLAQGTVAGRDVLLAGLVTSRGILEGAVVGLARLERPHAGFELRGRDTTRFWERWSDPPTFEQVRRLSGAAPSELGEDLRTWSVAEASSFWFGVSPGWLAAGGPTQTESLAVLLPDQVGVWLAALVGFADRWDAGPDR